MSTQPLPLSILCDVSVSVTPAGVAIPAFNQGLVGGNSGRLSSQGPDGRIAFVPGSSWENTLVGIGYQPTDPEYIAMGIYFGQNANPVTPPQYGWIGCQDPTSIQSITVDSAAAGTNWAENDIFLITQSGASYGYGRVTGVTDGVVTSVQAISGQQGTAYSVATGLSTVAQLPSIGVGLEINITAVGETPLQAIIACRLANPGWYEAMWTNAVDADDVAITAWAQTATPATQYRYGTTSLSALQGTAGNVFSAIAAANYNRGQGAYTSTFGGASPNNAYIAAAVMGVEMGLNTGAPGSAYTAAAKTFVGITPTALTQTQINVFAGTPGVSLGNKGNSYNNYANSYSFYYQGINGNGMLGSVITGLDMLAADCQISVLNVLASLPSIPQTDGGQALILNACRGACSRAANRGFIAGGIWNGAAINLLPTGGLTPGEALSNGFWVGSSSFSTQTSGNRALFQGMPVYIAVILAGSQQSFIIGINVQQ